MEELDEFGIPIKAESNQPEVDEFGIPVKKKEPTTQGSGQPAKPSTPSFGQKITEKITNASTQVPFKTAQQAQQPAEEKKKATPSKYFEVDVTEPQDVTAVKPAVSPVEMAKREAISSATPQKIAEKQNKQRADNDFYVNVASKEVFKMPTYFESKEYASDITGDYLNYLQQIDPEKGTYTNEKYKVLKAKSKQDRTSTDEGFLRQVESEAINKVYDANTERLKLLGSNIGNLEKIAVTPSDRSKLDYMYKEYEKISNSLQGLTATYQQNNLQYGKIAGQEMQGEEDKRIRFERMQAGEGKTKEFFTAVADAAMDGILSTYQFPKVMGDLMGDKDYDWSDEFYDSISGAKSSLDLDLGAPLPQGTSTSDLPFAARAALVGGNAIGTMGIFMLGGATGGATKLGQRAATFATSFLTQESNYYEEALSAGMSPQDAAITGSYLAAQMALFETIIPDIGYLNAAGFKKGVISGAAQAMKSGLPVKEAAKLALKNALSALPENALIVGKNVVKSGGKEFFVEELPQNLAEDVAKEVINNRSQKAYFNDTFNVDNYVDAAIGSFVAAGGMSAAGSIFSKATPKSPVQEQVMRHIVENRDKIFEKGTASDNIAGAEGKKEVNEAGEILDAMKGHSGWNEMSRQDQDHAFALAQQADVMKKEQEKMKKLRIPDEQKDAQIKQLENEVNTMFAEQLEKQKQKKNDQENIQGVPSEVGEGQEPIATQPVEVTGEEAAPAGGVLQAQEEIEAKKADIEQRRQDEIQRLTDFASKPSTIFNQSELESLVKQRLEEINAGYDEELAALEASKTEAAPQAEAAPQVEEAAPEVTPESEVEATAKALEGAYKDKHKFNVLKHLTGTLRSNLVDVEYALADEESAENAEVYGKIKEIGNSITEDMEAMEKDGFSGTFDEVRQQFEGRFNEAKALLETLPKYKEVTDLLSQFDRVSNESVLNWIKTNSAYKSGKYYKAKTDGSDPQLVKEVEDLIGEPAAEAAPKKVSDVEGYTKDTFENREAIENNLKDLGDNVYYHGSDDISYLNSKEDLNTKANTKNAESKYLNINPKASVAISYSIRQQKIGEKSGVAAFKLKGKGYTMKDDNIKALKSNEDYEAFYDKKKSEGYDYVKVPQDANDIVVLNNNAIEYIGKKLNKEALEKSLLTQETEETTAEPIAEKPSKQKKKAEPKPEKPKRQQVEDSLKKLRDQGLLVTADTSLLAKAKKLVGKKPKAVPMSDKEIAAQMKLLDAMAKVWKGVTGQDNYYEEFINEVKKGDLKKLQDMGGVLYQEGEVTSETGAVEILPVSFKPRVSLAMFNLPPFKAMEGKMVAAQNIKDMVKTKAKQRGEKDILDFVLNSDKYKDQKKFYYDDFRRDVELAVMNFEKHYTSSYATYGMNNLGKSSVYGSANTIVFNAPVNHGYSGHWNNIYDPVSFSKRNWQLREVPQAPGTYAAWDADAPAGIGEDELMNYVGTAGTKEYVEAWIKDVKNIGADRNKVKVGLFGHIRTWVNGDKFYVAELQSDTHQKYNKQMGRPLDQKVFAPEIAPQQMFQFLKDVFYKNILIEAEAYKPVFKEILDGLGIRENNGVYEMKMNDTEYFPVITTDQLNEIAEASLDQFRVSRERNMRSDYSRINGESPLRDQIPEYTLVNLLRSYSTSMHPGQTYIDEEYPNGGFIFLGKPYPENDYGLNYRVYADRKSFKFENKEDWNNYNNNIVNTLAGLVDAEYAMRGLLGKIRDNVLSYSNARDFILQQADNEIAELNKVGGLRFEKQFLDLDKNYMTRLVRESIRLAAESGAKTMLIPSPRTLAFIEGYVNKAPANGETNRAMPYETEDGSDSDLSVGDIITVEDEEYRVVEANATDIKVVKKDQVYEQDLYEEVNERAWNDVSEIRYEVRQALKRNGYPEADVSSREKFLIKQEHIDAIKDYDFTHGSVIETMQNELDRTSNTETIEDEDGNEIDEVSYITFDDIEEELAESIKENMLTWDPADIFGGSEVFEANASGYYYVVSDYSADILEYKQPDQYDEIEAEEEGDGAMAKDASFESNFRSLISKDQSTVVQKYIDLRSDFKKLRPDSKPFVDENDNVWYETEVTPEDLDNPIIAFQKEGDKAKAAIDFMDEGRATVYIFKGADISSLAHEMTGHIGRRVLERLAAMNPDFAKDYEATKKWAGVKGDLWNTAAEEKFARGFERYLRAGKAPNKSLQSVFNKLREWLSNIYEQIKGGSIDVNITPRMKKVFDNLLAYKPEPKTETKTETKTKAEEVKRKPKQEILDKAKRLAELYREIKSGNVSIRPELDDLLEQNPKLNYLYKNLPDINAKLEKDGLITKKTDGCP